MAKREAAEVAFRVGGIGGDEIELVELGGHDATFVVGITKGITRELVLRDEPLRQSGRHRERRRF